VSVQSGTSDREIAARIAVHERASHKSRSFVRSIVAPLLRSGSDNPTHRCIIRFTKGIQVGFIELDVLFLRIKLRWTPAQMMHFLHRTAKHRIDKVEFQKTAYAHHLRARVAT